MDVLLSALAPNRGRGRYSDLGVCVQTPATFLYGAGQVDGISLLLPLTLSPCHVVTLSPTWWETA
jgi:hypothetical protein